MHAKRIGISYETILTIDTNKLGYNKIMNMEGGVFFNHKVIFFRCYWALHKQGRKRNKNRTCRVPYRNDFFPKLKCKQKIFSGHIATLAMQCLNSVRTRSFGSAFPIGSALLSSILDRYRYPSVPVPVPVPASHEILSIYTIQFHKRTIVFLPIKLPRQF